MVALPHTFNQEPFFKEQFALFMFQGFTPFIAALKIWPNDNGFALSISERWQHDPYVTECVEKLRADKEAADKPPDKERLLKELWDRTPGMRDEEKIKAYRLIAEISGFIEKAPVAQINNNNTQNRVLIVHDKGDDDQWERGVAAQQSRLIENARS